MKKKLLYIIALILTGIANSASIYGQSSTLDRLQGKTWRNQWPVGYENDGYWEFTYSNDKETFVLYNSEGKPYPSRNRSFYLSDQIENQFDDSKVGKSKNGKYLTIKTIPQSGPSGISILEISKLTDTEFTMKSLKSGLTTTYKAILDTFSMKNMLEKTPTGTLPFVVGRNTSFLNGCNVVVKEKTIPDKIYKDVQLTK